MLSLLYLATSSPSSTLSMSSASRTPSPFHQTVHASGNSIHANNSTPSMSIGGSCAVQASASTDTYSRKVFVGGLPPDIDEGT